MDTPNEVRKMKFIFLLFLITLHISCAERPSGQKEGNKPASFSAADTLTFTSGVRSIFQDSKGNYWFGSHREGVSRFDGKAFYYFTTREGLSDNHVYAIQEDQNGTIWFDTQNGVSNFNGERMTRHTTKENGVSQHDPAGTYPGVAQGEWMKADADLWFSAGTSEGVFRFDGQKITWLAFPNPKSRPHGNVFSVTGFSWGKDQMLWISTFAGVFGYNGQELISISDETLGLTDASYNLHVRSILEDSKGRLWIGNNGIGVLLKDGDSIIHFSKEQGKLMPMNEFKSNTQNKQFEKNTGLQAVFAMEEDREGNIWFGDRDTGAWKYDGVTLTNYPVDTTLKSQMIWTIYSDNGGNLLFGMAEGGVYRYNGTIFERAF
jgi:ligand-binding sensor domain-containing protein